MADDAIVDDVDVDDVDVDDVVVDVVDVESAITWNEREDICLWYMIRVRSSWIDWWWSGGIDRSGVRRGAL